MVQCTNAPGILQGLTHPNIFMITCTPSHSLRAKYTTQVTHPIYSNVYVMGAQSLMCSYTVHALSLQSSPSLPSLVNNE